MRLGEGVLASSVDFVRHARMSQPGESLWFLFVTFYTCEFAAFYTFQ